MILLDTNVVSGMMRPFPDPAVIRWLDTQVEADVWISAIVMAEILLGIEDMVVLGPSLYVMGDVDSDCAMIYIYKKYIIAYVQMVASIPIRFEVGCIIDSGKRAHRCRFRNGVIVWQ